MKELGNTPGPEGKKPIASGQVPETAPKKNVSLFPIDEALTRSTLNELQKRISMSNQDHVTGESLKKVYKKNNTLFNDIINSANNIKNDPEFEDGAFGYLFGVATGYEILEKQALMHDKKVPTVSQEVIDGFDKEVEEAILSDEDITEAFWDGISTSSEKDPGFSLPLQEVALDIMDPQSRKGFLLGTFDVYLKVRGAEKIE